MDYLRAWAEIDMSSLANNVQTLRRVIPPHTRMMAAVKANAYGHGIKEVSKTLLKNGIDTLGVAIAEEGIELRKSGITAPILVMGYTPAPMLEEAISYGLTLTVFSAESYPPLSKVVSKLGKRAEVHIKIDTGMGRLGFLPGRSSADKICQMLQGSALKVTGIYTHLATSGFLDTSFMCEQYARFEYMLGLLEKRGVPVRYWVRHVGNSGALAQTLREDRCADLREKDIFMDMMRIGIMLYGLSPSTEMLPICKKLGLMPVMRLMAKVSMTKTLPPGSGVSYGHSFCTSRDTLVATLSVGYADGYPRLLSNKGKIMLRGCIAPIIGTVCMDQCMADITDIPDAKSIRPGENVTMFGSSIFGVEEVAAQTGAIGYEVICGVGERIPKIFT